MQNPTLAVLTGRNDLDDQLFGQFQRCADILGQTSVQVSGREHLRELLNRASGGVVFTTIHKFMPPNAGSSRREEAHSQPEGDQSLVTSAATEVASLSPSGLPTLRGAGCLAMLGSAFEIRLTGIAEN